MSDIRQSHGSTWAVTATYPVLISPGFGTAMATATVNASAGVTHYITDISGSSDRATATIVLQSGATGGTVLWRNRVSNSGAFQENFKVPIVGITGSTVIVTVDGQVACYSNLQGYSL